MNFNLLIKININFDFTFNKRIFISIVVNYYPNIEINTLFN